jgi:hypothetical protein
VLGLLGFSWDRAQELFYKKAVNLNPYDEEMTFIGVKAYNVSLKAGYAAGAAASPQAKQVLLSRLKRLAGHPSPGRWNDRDKIDYVIALASAGVAKGVFDFDD